MILFLSDIHLGVKLPNQDFYTSLAVSFDMFKKEAVIHGEDCEAIMICGDLFDHALNIDEMINAVGIIMYLSRNNCGCTDEQPHVPVHIIEGTFSHDRNQMKIFEQFLRVLPNINVWYYPTKTKVTLPSGKRVLMLPQEYGNVDYTNTFNDTYDLIIGHGPMSSTSKSVVASHGNEIMHSVETLSKISKLCVFGHYHEYTDFGNGVYYTGSMLRFRYGEDTDKMIFMCDDKFNVITHKNPIAKEFKTIEIHDPEQLRDVLSNDIKTPHRFVIQSNDVEELKTYHAIMNTTKQNTNIKFKVVAIEETEDNTIMNDDTSESSHMEESSNTVVEPVDALIEYISTKYDMDTSKQIHDYVDKINRETK